MPDLAEGDVVSFGPFRLYARERRLERGGRAVKLGSRALDVLLVLTQRAGEVVSKEELVARVWPDTAVDGDNSLRVQVAGLRRALGHGLSGVRYVINVPGRGYVFAVPPSGPAGAPSRRSERRASPLPARLERIVGRDADIADIGRELSARRFVAIVGPGGMGKTTVAVAVAHAQSPGFDGDVCFVDLSMLTDPSQVGASLASSLGLALPADAPAEGFVAFLRDRRLLVVLDSCEHVLASVAPLAERIIAETARVHILATTREPLRVLGEHVHRLAPLESPAEMEGITAWEALTFPAVQLFVERAATGGAQPTITDADAEVVAGICKRLDGIALAIEVAAARVDAYGIRGVASLLDNRSRLLWQGRRTAASRHQSLGADLDWSYQLLDDVERRVLRRLSWFVGPFSLQAGAAVAGDAAADLVGVIHAVGSLVEKSLVSMDVGAAEARYRLLDTTRTYALEKLDEAREGQPIARRHAEYYCTLLEDDAAAEHLGNVRRALEWTFSADGDKSLATRLAATSAPLFMALSLLTECQGWVEAALAVLADGERGTMRELRLQAALAVALMFTRGHGPEVRAALRRGLALAEEVDDPREQLRLLGALNIHLTRTDEIREALAVAVRSEDVAERLMDPAARSFADWMIGACCHLLGDQAEAERRCRSALEPPPRSHLGAMLQFGFDHRIRGLVMLARTLWLVGRPDEAVAVAARAVEDATRLAQSTPLAISINAAASVYLWTGDWDAAHSHIEQLIHHSVKHSLIPYYWVGMGFKGKLAVARGDPTGLELLFRAVDALHAQRYEILYTSFAIATAEGLGLAGRFEEAVKTIDDAIATTATRNGSSFDMAEMLRVKGDLLATTASPRAAEAEPCLIRSIECAKEQKAIAWELRTTTTLARLLATRGRAAEGRERLAAVYDQFTQGLETHDLVAARTLLSELQKTRRTTS